ncbi:MAG: hypothetical protein NTZ83_04420 [Candidatus Pacearchaeota archaeon]|nr:hypothetical protein [Candidatus Pacearchaeota archaeon]
MLKKNLQLPQLTLVKKLGGKTRYLERLTIEAGEPKADLTFQEDSNDSRIIAIKYQVPGEEPGGSIFYYSEEPNRNTIVTFNLGYNYQGRVLAKNYKNQNIGINLIHLPKEGLRKKHIERINQLEDVRKDLTPEYVAKRYQDFFYNLQIFT